MSCPAAPISAYLLRAFHVSLVTRHSGGGGGGGGCGGGDCYQDPWCACALRLTSAAAPTEPCHCQFLWNEERNKWPFRVTSLRSSVTSRVTQWRSSQCVLLHMCAPAGALCDGGGILRTCLCARPFLHPTDWHLPDCLL